MTDPDDETALPYQHQADGTPTSEPCEGLRECADCQDVLASNAGSLDPGDHLGLYGGYVLRVHGDHTFHLIDPNDYHPDAATLLDGADDR